MRILVADDDVSARRLVSTILERWGHDVIQTENGEETWLALQEPDAPRLAILDWEMPGLTGIEVCELIREHGGSLYTYVILFTAKDGEDDISKAFAVGVDDFLHKRFNRTHLMQRLTVAARVLAYSDEVARGKRRLERYAADMEELAKERARQLVHADRMTTLGVLSAGVAHEINNPMTFISGNVQILNDCWPAVRDRVEAGLAKDGDEDSRLRFIMEEVPKIHAGIAKGVERITKIVSGLKAYAHPGSDTTEPIDVNACVEQSLELCANALKNRVTVEKHLADSLPVVMGDGQQIDQVLINLIVNASDALPAEGGGTLRIETTAEADGVRITVEDDGPGLPPEIIEQIWKPFFTTKEPGEGTGLGLSIIQGIIQSHGGTIHAENRESGGARFTIRLPGQPSPKGVPEEVAMESMVETEMIQ